MAIKKAIIREIFSPKYSNCAVKTEEVSMQAHKSFLEMLIYSESSHKDTCHVFRLRSVNNTGVCNKSQVLITKCSLIPASDDLNWIELI